MIDLLDKSQCCGCGACENVCPHKCIKMMENDEGFLYPIVDKCKCVDCGLCEKVCPTINHTNNVVCPEVYAATNKDEEVRDRSSSGGIFTLLAEYIIDKDGVVFGARFDKNWNVQHDYTENKKDLILYNGSKYLQSRIGDCYIKARMFLEKGRWVLFSGTPCQIAGLKNYLRKEYRKLLTVEVVCHGVPSPKVWQSYLSENSKHTISNVNFRSKTVGWKKYNLCFTYKNGDKKEEPFNVNPYMNLFLSNLSIRPSCYKCSTKIFNSYSDISIADFWGVDKISPLIDDDKGCSLVLINNKKMLEIFQKLNCCYYLQKFDEIVKYNPSIVYSTKEPINRKFFFTTFNKFGFFKAYKLSRSSFFLYRLIRYIYRSL